jgi:hypothetical protein
MKKPWIALALLLSTGCLAADRPAGAALSNLLIKDEWPGAVGFVAEVTRQKGDVCNLMTGATEKYADTAYVERRVMQVLSLTKCSGKLAIAQKFIDSEHPLLREAAISLSATLPDEQTFTMKKRILTVKKSEQDPAVSAAISDFLKDPPTRRIASPRKK